jgi:hypothetical protein
MKYITQVLETLPKDTNPIFIVDSAKWIWNFAETYFPKVAKY